MGVLSYLMVGVLGVLISYRGISSFMGASVPVPGISNSAQE